MRDKHLPPEASEPDPRTDEFDPYRFGRITFTTGFFKKLISTPLPEPNDEDLVDIAPGDGPTAEEARQAAARLKAHDLDQTQPKKIFWSPAELSALGREPRARRRVLLVVGCATVLALLTFLVSRNQRSKSEGRPMVGETRGGTRTSSAENAAPRQANALENKSPAGGDNENVSVPAEHAAERARPNEAEAMGRSTPPPKRQKPDSGPSAAAAPEAVEPTLVEAEAAESRPDLPSATSKTSPKANKPRFGPKL